MTPPSSFEKYLSIETAGGPTWHPNGKKIAFVSDASGTFQVYSCDIATGKTQHHHQLTREDDRCTNPHYLPDGTLIFTRDRGGDENFQLGIIEENGNLSWLTSDLNVKHNLMLITNSYVYFTANVLNRARLDVYRWKMPLLENKAELVFKPVAGLIRVSAASSDDSKILLTQYFGNMDQHILLFDVNKGEIQDLTAAISGNEHTRWDVVRWLNHNHILVNTDHESDLNRLCILTLTGNIIPIEETKEKMNFEIEPEYAYRHDSIWTYFIENQDGYSTIHRGQFFETGITEFETLPFPLRGVVPTGDARSWIQGMSLSRDEHLLAMTVSSGIQPTSVWILNIKDMTSWRAHKSDIAGLDPSVFVEATLHHFSSFDGLSIPYFRYLPTGKQPVKGWPTIIMIHGGPESQIRPDFNPVIQFYISAGFAIITPNIRGSTGYGRNYLNLDNIEKRLDSIMDIRYLALHLKENDKEIDGDRLIVYGGSYGGFAVLSAMTEHPDLWKAGVDIVGISNFVTFLQNTAAWRRSLRESEYGSLERDLATLEKISPIHKIDNIDAPLFIIQGDNDERVPLSESIQMYEKLKEKGLAVKLMRFADEGHGLAKRSNKINAYSEVLAWLKEII